MWSVCCAIVETISAAPGRVVYKARLRCGRAQSEEASHDCSSDGATRDAYVSSNSAGFRRAPPASPTRVR